MPRFNSFYLTVESSDKLPRVYIHVLDALRWFKTMSLSKKKMFVFLVRSLSSMFLEINVSKLTKLLNFKMYNSHNLVDLNRFVFQVLIHYQIFRTVEYYLFKVIPVQQIMNINPSNIFCGTLFIMT